MSISTISLNLDLPRPALSSTTIGSHHPKKKARDEDLGDITTVKIFFIFPLNCHKFKSTRMSMSPTTGICILQCQHSEACGHKKWRAQDNEMRKQDHYYFTSKTHQHFFMCLIKLCLCHSHVAVTSQLSFVNDKPMGTSGSEEPD